VELALLIGTIAIALGAGIGINSLLVRIYDPKGLVARAKEEKRRGLDRETDRGNAASRLGERVVQALPSDRVSESALALRLTRAGMNPSPANYWGFVVVSTGIGAAIGLLLFVLVDTNPAGRILIAGFFVLVGALVPRFYVSIRTKNRAAEMEAALPSTLMLLSVIVEAGQTIERGIREIAERTDGPLADEFRVVNADITRYHKKTSSALSDLSRRCNVKSVALFCTSVSQALEQGSAIGRILKTQAEIASENYYMEVEEKSNKIAVKMSVVTIFFLLIPVLIISVGPAVINLMNNSGGLLGM